MRRAGLGLLAALVAMAAPAGGAQAPAERPEAAVGAAAEVREAAAFSLWFGGLPIGELRYRLEIGEERWAVRADMRSTGLAELLFGVRLEAEGAGRLGSGPQPEQYFADVSLRDDRQAVEVRFAPGGRPETVEADPPWKPKPWQIDPQAQSGVLDPTAAAAVLAAPQPVEALCDVSLEIYDGRRRSRVTLGEAEAAQGGWRCEGAWVRVAGYKPEDMARGPSEISAEYVPGGDGLARLRRLAVKTSWGTAVALRQD
ncbi:MAG: DUF3108 domain-containing protein [Pseudomonadota bacterium]